MSYTLKCKMVLNRCEESVYDLITNPAHPPRCPAAMMAYEIRKVRKHRALQEESIYIIIFSDDNHPQDDDISFAPTYNTIFLAPLIDLITIRREKLSQAIESFGIATSSKPVAALEARRIITHTPLPGIRNFLARAYRYLLLDSSPSFLRF
eukprot:scaffold294_cov221-Amphora_coffeaeformis.AAC.66